MHLGIDLGSGSVKVLLVGADGREYESSEGYPISSPEPGFAETAPELWLRALESALGALPSLKHVRSVGFSGQMHGVVPISLSKGVATSPAITWADGRGKAYLPRLAEIQEELEEAVRNTPAAGMAATSLLWLRERVPEVYRETDVFLFPKDYLRWRLTGEIGTEPSDASGSLLYDFRSRGWSQDIVEHLGLGLEKLPPLGTSLEVAGHVTAAAADRFGIPEGVPVAYGLGDTPAAMYGTGVTEDGEIQISVGTAAQVARPVTGLPPFHPGLNLFEGPVRGVRYRIAAMLNGGLALEWMRRVLGYDWEKLYGQIEGGALTPPEDLLFLPYLTGERTPYMDPDARGAWIGLSLHHEPIHLALAAMTGVAFTVRLGLETLGTRGVERFRLVGGSSRYSYWARLIAGVIGHPIHLSTATNGSARGAAMTGATAVGEELSFPQELTLIEPLDLPGIDEQYDRFKRAYLTLKAL